MPEPTPPLTFTAESIVDTVREPMLVLSADLVEQRANRSFYRTFAWTPEKTVDQLVYDLGDGQWNIPALRRLLEEILPLNTSFDDFEVTHDFPSIGRKVMILNARRIYREPNDTQFILLAFEDITERWKTEDALVAQQEWLRVTLRSIGDAVIATDTVGRVTLTNQVAEELTGWSSQEASGTPLDQVFRIVNEETRHTVENLVTKALREGAVVGLANHTLLIRKDGTERSIDDSAAPIRDAKGGVGGVVLVFHDITERRRIERAAQDALEYARNIVETVREPMLVLDGQLRVRTANPSFYRTFQVVEGETEGRLLYDLGNRQWDIPTLRKLLDEILPQQSSFNDFEITHDFESIGRRVMLVNARRVQQDQHDTGLILLAIEDITERRRLEDERRELETRFTSLVKNIRDHSIFTLDFQGHITSWNREAERILGFTEAEAIGQHFSVIFTPEDILAGIPAQELATALTDGRAEDERWHMRKNGERFWALGIVTPTQDAAGAHTGYSKILRDMTDRKRAEERLAVSEIRYRRLFEAAKDGILILDTHHGRITDANPFMCQLLGYSHNDFIGKELWEIGLFSDKSENEAAVRELQQNGYARYEHLPLESMRGQRVEVEIVANVYREDHQPVIQCNIRDITERSRMEKRLKEQAESLADLHRRKDEFLPMLSHELRNPLAPISNAVQLLRLQKNEDQLQHSARTIIERQVNQLTRLIDDLLEVARITTGRIHLHQERLALNGVVEQAVESVRPQIEQRRHALKLTLPPQPIWLYADAARLEQVIVNLLTNAAKYTDDAGQIFLSVQQEGDEAVLRVRDSGVGIAPDLLPRIFDLFTQAERSLDRSQGGLGIGLSLVQRLVELHRGRVEAHSSLGHGSEFVVRLPVVLTPAPPPAAQKETAEPTGSSLRILVVDDNVDSAESLAALLRASRHDVRMAHDGLSALEAALDYLPNVVLLDIGLPKMDGYEVAKKMGQNPAFKNVVLVAMTGYGQDSDRQRSQEAGFDHHLVKPADFGKVLQILATVS